MPVEGKTRGHFVRELAAAGEESCLGVSPRTDGCPTDEREQHVAHDETTKREDTTPRYYDGVYPRCLFTHWSAP